MSELRQRLLGDRLARGAQAAAEARDCQSTWNSYVCRCAFPPADVGEADRHRVTARLGEVVGEREHKDVQVLVNADPSDKVRAPVKGDTGLGVSHVPPAVAV